MDKYIIIPGCSDLNRGDQALVWETKRLAEEAGFKGEYYLISEKNEPVEQSIKQGLKIISPILEHPSRKFRNKENIKYTKTLKIKWGIVAIGDLVSSVLLLWKPTRSLAKCLMSKDKKEVLKLFQESKAIFMKGGGLLQTYGGLTSTYSMYFWTYPILLAHKLRIPVYVMPNSFGPFEGPFVKAIARKALSKCKIVTARESLSQDIIKKDLCMDVPVYADLAFELESSCIDKDRFFKDYNIPKGKKLVGLTMRPYRFPNSNDSTASYELFKGEMAKFIRWLSSEGYMPVLVEHTLAVNAHENDGNCIREVISMLEQDEYRCVFNREYNCKDLKRIYSFFDYIVGTRFHSMIFSFGSKVPGIAISYVGNKSKGIMHDMDLDEYVLCIEDVRGESLINKFSYLKKNEFQVKENIDTYIMNAKKDRKDLISRLHISAKSEYRSKNDI